MDHKDGRGNGLERRLSMRAPARVSVSVEDDELDLSAALVSDGFRPQGMASTPPAPPRLPPPIQTVPSTNVPEPPTAASSGRRSSISKPHRPQESFSLRHEGGMGPIDEASPSLNRSTSRSTQSTAYIPQPDGPYRGPSGPSHPYPQYPQNVVRTMSMTTVSTGHVSESSYNGPTAPAYAYGMHTQEAGQYQRRLGPEGEDMGIVGPGGHTEELPPYSERADTACERKARDFGTEPATLGIGAQVVRPARRSSLPAIPGAGGLGLATRNPEFESREDLDSPRSGRSFRSSTSDSSEHEVNLAAEKAGNMSEKEQPVTGWRGLMRRKVWNTVPMWSLGLVGVVLLLMAIILGSVVGTFMSKEKSPSRMSLGPGSSFNPTMTFDARPIPTPTDLPPLAEGRFSMPIRSVSRSHRGCFNDTTQAQAWQCHSIISNFEITIAKPKKDSLGDYTASITCNTSNTVANNIYSYGEQPFLIEKPVTLDLVTDTQEPNRGPAWYYMTKYDKIVVVPENSIKVDDDPKANRRRIRDFVIKYPIGATDFKRKKPGIPDGHKPWICTWEGAFLEVFVYAQQNSSFYGMKPPAPSPLPSSSTANPPPPKAEPTGPKADPTPGPKPTPEARVHENDLHAADDRKPPPPAPTPPPSPNVVAAAEQPTSSSVYGFIDSENFTPPPPLYPRVIKIEQRHMYGPAKVRCEKVEIQEEGPAKPLNGPDGKPLVVEIIEAETYRDPELERTELERRSSSPLVDRRDAGGNTDSRNQCSCMWFIT
ncbi:hypothetical protein QBC39DRAFT_304850 [Podospora conica]|nr:hypothetical protein QBC39DRAFT_304850 [Schizothecium conicum]